ncbi:hypothetical protein pb186bvf_020191 [Paramecium bursaria]
MRLLKFVYSSQHLTMNTQYLSQISILDLIAFLDYNTYLVFTICSRVQVYYLVQLSFKSFSQNIEEIDQQQKLIQIDPLDTY